MSESRVVPFLSQYDDSVPERWQKEGCGIVALIIVLRTLSGERTLSIENLFDEGESIGGFGPRGWTHDALVILAHNHGVHAYKQEFRSNDETIANRLAEEGALKIKKTLAEGLPVLVSIEKPNGSYHIVVLIEMSKGGFVYHDPEAGQSQIISFDEFLKKWRRLSVFFEE